MRRRKFILSVGGAVVMRPMVARTQQANLIKRIGFLMPSSMSDVEAQEQVTAFRGSLQELGWQDGRNVRIDTRWTLEAGRIRELARELVELKPDVIVGRSTAVAAILRQETQVIPIVFMMVSDPVGDGIVESFAHPGGNATGFTNVEASLGGKWLQLLKDINSGITRVAVMYGANTSPGNGSYYMRLIQDAAASIAASVVAVPIQNTDDIEVALSAFMQAPNGGLVVTPDLTTTLTRKFIIQTAARHRLPAVYPLRYVVREGGLLSYGVNVIDIFRRSAGYVDRILRGTKPSDLPVQAPTKFELVINLTTAKALGITVPPTMLAIADEVIE